IAVIVDKNRTRGTRGTDARARSLTTRDKLLRKRGSAAAPVMSSGVRALFDSARAICELTRIPGGNLIQHRRELGVMRTFHTDKGMTRMQVSIAIALVLLLSFLVVFLLRHEDANGLQSAFERSVKKLQIIQAMSHDLLASAEAEKSAVMANTDEASQAFAEQSIQAAQNVEKARRELEHLLEGNRQHAHLFHEFSRCWEQLQAIDQEVLSLAVQNTNLKALRLSFVPAAEALRHMEEALNHLMDWASSSPDAVKITRLASQAVTSALHLYTLQAPHIAESTATRMEEMEAVMQSLDAQVTDALQSLQALVNGPGKPFLDV